jgi:hypothetical protein
MAGLSLSNIGDSRAPAFAGLPGPGALPRQVPYTVALMPILLLIRHATNDFVKTGRLPGQGPNLHLNEEGRKQAEALAKMLEKRPITAIYSSHLSGRSKRPGASPRHAGWR